VGKESDEFSQRKETNNTVQKQMLFLFVESIEGKTLTGLLTLRLSCLWFIWTPSALPIPANAAVLGLAAHLMPTAGHDPMLYSS
jgi:hypothetical protein